MFPLNALEQVSVLYAQDDGRQIAGMILCGSISYKQLPCCFVVYDLFFCGDYFAVPDVLVPDQFAWFIRCDILQLVRLWDPLQLSAVIKLELSLQIRYIFNFCCAPVKVVFSSLQVLHFSSFKDCLPLSNIVVLKGLLSFKTWGVASPLNLTILITNISDDCCKSVGRKCWEWCV